MITPCGKSVLQEEEKLQNRQLGQCKPRVDEASCAGAPVLIADALFRGDVEKPHAASAKVDRVSVMNGQAAVRHIFFIYPDAALGKYIKNLPFTLIAAAQYGMDTADALSEEPQVSRAGFSDEAFPVLNGHPFFSDLQISPDFLFRLFIQERAEAAQHQQYRQRGNTILGYAEDIVCQNAGRLLCYL